MRTPTRPAYRDTPPSREAVQHRRGSASPPETADGPDPRQEIRPAERANWLLLFPRLPLRLVAHSDDPDDPLQVVDRGELDRDPPLAPADVDLHPGVEAVRE